MGEGVRGDVQKRGGVPGRLRAVEGRVPRPLQQAGLPRRLPRLRPYEARFRAALDKRTLRRRPQGHAPYPQPQPGGARREGWPEPVHPAKLRAGKAHAALKADGGPLRSAGHHLDGPDAALFR